MIQDKIFFDEKDPTGLSYNTPFTFYGSYQGRLWSKSPSGSIQYYTQNSDLSVYATTGSNQFNGNQAITGSLTVTGGIIGTTATSSYVEYSNVANKPTLVSGSSQVSFSGITNKPTLVSGSAQVSFSGITNKPTLVSSSVQVKEYNVFATTGSNGFNGSQSITGSLTVTGQVVAQTLNVQQVTSSIVYSSGSNIFGNNSGNTHQFTGSVNITGSLSVNGAGTFSSNLVAPRILINSSDAAKTPLLLNAEGNFASSGNMTSGFAITNTSFGRALNMGVFESGAYGWIQAAYINNADTTFALALQPRGGNVGIGTGTTSPSNILSVVQSNSASSTTLDITNSSNASSTAKTAQLLFRLADTENTIKNAAYVQAIPDGVNVLGAHLSFGTRLSDTGPTERMRITSGGNVGIGTDAPGANLHVVRANDGGSGTPGVILRTDNGANDIVRFQDGTTIVAVVKNDGSIGIGTGTSSLEARLDLRGTGNTALNSRGNLFVSDGGTATQAAGEGGQISFGAWLNGDLTKPYPLAAIKGVSESSTVNINGGALILGTMSSATTVVERMRITSGFSVSVPNATYTTLFDIASVLTVGSTGIVNVYASSGSGLGVATLIIMRDGIGGVSQAQIGTQPTANYFQFQISGTNLQVFAAISAGTHTVQGTIIRISS